jgi:putative spermidine/putrescine transport system substrate-binding protein
MKYRITRRHFLASTGAGAAAALIGPRAFAAAAAADLTPLKGTGQVIVSTWGGSYTDAQTKAFFDPFTKATGIKVVTTGTPDAAKMKLMEDSGNVEWDLVDAEGFMMFTAAKADQLAPVDYDLVYKVVPKEQLIAEAIKPYGLPSVAFGWVIAWSTKTAKQGPQSWAEFFDVQKFPGRRALYAQPKPILEIALLADGVPMDKIYPLDVDRAFKKLDTIRSHVDVWYSDTGQVDVLLQNGEVDYLLAGIGRVFKAKNDGVPVDYTFNQGIWEQSYWVVMKNSPNAQNAQKLLAFMAQAQPEADFVGLFPAGVPNKEAYGLISKNVSDNLMTSPKNLGSELQIDAKWWTDNQEAVNRRWLEWYSQ